MRNSDRVFSAEECPNCGEYVNGRECRKCGIDVEAAGTVRCYRCHDEVLKQDAKRSQVRSEYGGIKRRWVCKSGCSR